MKIKFTESVTVSATKVEKEFRFKKGSIHDLSEPSAYRWVRRDKAVYYVEEIAAPKLKVGRPMMAETRTFKPDEVAKVFSVGGDDLKKPKKRGRPPKKDPGVVPRNIGPPLPVKGSGTNGGPGWDDA